MPEIEKCPCAGCRDKREVRLRTELASQAAKIEAVRGLAEKWTLENPAYEDYAKAGEAVLAALKS
jgi:hypothetical protein